MPTNGQDDRRGIAGEEREAVVGNTSSRSSTAKPIIFAVDAGVESFRRIEYGLNRRRSAG